LRTGLFFGPPRDLLPLAAFSIASPKWITPAPTQGSSAVARILLVEDDLGVRPLLEHVIASDGHEVLAVESVKNALLYLATQPFDLVVTDALLPDGSGMNLADAAKEKGVRTLVITGYGLSLPAGSLAQYDYLLKPLRPKEILEAIRARLPRDRDNGQVVPFPKT
jgi:DNA-binding NtrC family response regulator